MLITFKADNFSQDIIFDHNHKYFVDTSYQVRFFPNSEIKEINQTQNLFTLTDNQKIKTEDLNFNVSDGKVTLKNDPTKVVGYVQLDKPHFSLIKMPSHDIPGDLGSSFLSRSLVFDGIFLNDKLNLLQIKTSNFNNNLSNSSFFSFDFGHSSLQQMLSVDYNMLKNAYLSKNTQGIKLTLDNKEFLSDNIFLSVLDYLSIGLDRQVLGKVNIGKIIPLRTAGIKESQKNFKIKVSIINQIPYIILSKFTETISLDQIGRLGILFPQFKDFHNWTVDSFTENSISLYNPAFGTVVSEYIQGSDIINIPIKERMKNILMTVTHTFSLSGEMLLSSNNPKIQLNDNDLLNLKSYFPSVKYFRCWRYDKATHKIVNHKYGSTLNPGIPAVQGNIDFFKFIFPQNEHQNWVYDHTTKNISNTQTNLTYNLNVNSDRKAFIAAFSNIYIDDSSLVFNSGQAGDTLAYSNANGDLISITLWDSNSTSMAIAQNKLGNFLVGSNFSDQWYFANQITGEMLLISNRETIKINMDTGGVNIDQINSNIYDPVRSQMFIDDISHLEFTNDSHFSTGYFMVDHNQNKKIKIIKIQNYVYRDTAENYIYRLDFDTYYTDINSCTYRSSDRKILKNNVVIDINQLNMHLANIPEEFNNFEVTTILGKDYLVHKKGLYKSIPLVDNEKVDFSSALFRGNTKDMACSLLNDRFDVNTSLFYNTMTKEAALHNLGNYFFFMNFMDLFRKLKSPLIHIGYSNNIGETMLNSLADFPSYIIYNPKNKTINVSTTEKSVLKLGNNNLSNIIDDVSGLENVSISYNQNNDEIQMINQSNNRSINHFGTEEISDSSTINMEGLIDPSYFNNSLLFFNSFNNMVYDFTHNKMFFLPAEFEVTSSGLIKNILPATINLSKFVVNNEGMLEIDVYSNGSHIKKIPLLPLVCPWKYVTSNLDCAITTNKTDPNERSNIYALFLKSALGKNYVYVFEAHMNGKEYRDSIVSTSVNVESESMNTIYEPINNQNNYTENHLWPIETNTTSNKNAPFVVTYTPLHFGDSNLEVNASLSELLVGIKNDVVSVKNSFQTFNSSYTNNTQAASIKQEEIKKEILNINSNVVKVNQEQSKIQETLAGNSNQLQSISQQVNVVVSNDASKLISEKSYKVLSWIVFSTLLFLQLINVSKIFIINPENNYNPEGDASKDKSSILLNVGLFFVSGFQCFLTYNNPFTDNAAGTVYLIASITSAFTLYSMFSHDFNKFIQDIVPGISSAALFCVLILQVNKISGKISNAAIYSIMITVAAIFTFIYGLITYKVYKTAPRSVSEYIAFVPL